MSEKKLRRALEDGRFDEAAALIEGGVSANTRMDADSGTILHFAIGERAWDFALFLLERGADIHTPDADGVSSWHAACLEPHGPLLEAMLARGADANESFEGDFPELRGRTPLMEVCGSMSGDLPGGVRVLLAAGADANGRDARGQTTLMHLVEGASGRAAQRAFGEVGRESGLMGLAATITKSVEIGREIADGRRSMEATSSDVEALELLVAAGADVNARDKVGLTALHRARRHGDPTLEASLTAHGATFRDGDERLLDAELDYGDESDFDD
jgi:ankyrin repeat protein